MRGRLGSEHDLDLRSMNSVNSQTNSGFATRAIHSPRPLEDDDAFDGYEKEISSP